MYKLSKDYGHLFDLLCQGKTVAAFVDYAQSLTENERDICKLVRHAPFDIFIGVRGTSYGGLYQFHSKYGDEREVFIHHCNGINLEWIAPENPALTT